jgi:hypothetical protein
MMRKHIACMTIDQLDSAPFYSWDCITIQLDDRYIDLVIENHKDMKMFIRFLVFSIKTIDGIRNSAIQLLNFLII